MANPYTLTPVITTTPGSPNTYNFGIASTFSWVPIETDMRPLFARAVYPITTDDRPVKVAYADSGNLAPFGRLRVVNPVSQFDSKSLYQKDSRYFWNNVQRDGGEVFNESDSSRTQYVTAAGGFTVKETYRRFPYQPGKGQGFLFTGVLSAEQNICKKVGMFRSLSANDYTANTAGIYFQALSTTNTQRGQEYAWVVANAPLSASTSTIVPSESATQSEWNIDRMDGTGPSGITIDFTKSQIFVMDYQWLGVGRVRCGFNLNGSSYYCHEFNHANKITGTYLISPNLPIRAELRALAGATSGSMKTICSSIISEGAAELANITRSCYLSAGVNPGDGLRKAVMGVRLRQGRTNVYNKVINVQAVPIVNNSSDICPFRWELVMRPALSSNSVSWFSITPSSNMEYGFDGTTGISLADQSEVIASGFGSTNTDIGLTNLEYEKVIVLGRDLTGKRDELWLVITPLSKSFPFYASFTVAEAD